MLYLFGAGLCLILTFHATVAAKSIDTEFGEREKKLSEYDWDVWCKFQFNGFDCAGAGPLSRFYYDVKLEGCKTFTYNNCPTSFNNFGSQVACHDACIDAGLRPITQNISDSVSCRLQPDFGECDEYHPMWYFDIVTRVCKGFSYSGCGGNYNRFPNAQVCAAVCRGIVDY